MAEQDKKAYWRWQVYVIRDWQPPARIDKLKAVGFALTLADFGTSGKSIYASGAKIAERANVCEKTAKDWRRKLVKLGLFRETGAKRGRVSVLEIATPDATVSERLPSWDDSEDEPALTRFATDTPIPAWKAMFASGNDGWPIG
jgi:hypothetical protein